MLEKPFPILKMCRLHVHNAVKVVIATAILHNLSVLWDEVAVEELPPQPDLEGYTVEDIGATVPHQDITIELDMPPEQVRRMGQGKRDNIRQTMSMTLSSSEQRKISL